MDDTVRFASMSFGSCLPLLVLVVALVVAIARWDQHSRASMYVVTGAVVMITATLGSRAVFAIAPGLSTDRLATTLAISGAASSLIDAIGLGLLVAAAFVDRSPSRER